MIDVEFVDRDRFEGALEIFERYADQSPNFTDAAAVHTVQQAGIDHALAFDDGFDGIVERLDPAEL